MSSAPLHLIPFNISKLPPNLAVIYHKVRRLLSLRSAEKIIGKLCEILDPQTRKHKYSLRTIEFFLTEYSQQHASSDTTLQMIYESYQRLVNSYSKKHFDCFARDIRIPVRVWNKVIQTTPAQLHFLQWFFEQSIDVEIERRVSDIRSEMKRKAVEKQKTKVKAKAKVEVKSASVPAGDGVVTRSRRKKQVREEGETTTAVKPTSSCSLSGGELRLYAKKVERLRANLRARRGAAGGTLTTSDCSSSQ